MKLFKLPLTLAAVLSVLLVATPASANHSLVLNCANPNPQTAGANADSTCSFTTHKANEKVQELRIDLPPTAWVNEDENGPGGGDGVTDPAHNDQVGTSTVATDLNYDGCGDANDGGTYKTYWRSHSNWTSYSVPSGWTKTAEFRTEFRVLFFFTEQVATHIIQNDSTGDYATVTIIPHGRGCAGAVTDWTINTWGYVDQDSGKADVAKNPTDCDPNVGSKDHDVTLTVTYTDNTTATDTDKITVTC